MNAQKLIQNSKLPNVGTTIFTIMSKMANEAGAINLSQGFPNFDSDPVLIEAVSKAMKDGHNQYAPMPGNLMLRQQIAAKLFSLYKKEYDPLDEITITVGATQAIFTAIAASIHPHDEVIIFTPAYDCYEPAIRLFGGKTVPVQLKAPWYSPDWEEVRSLINSKTKMIMVNSPHNPTGRILTRDDMLELQSIAEEHNLLVISDEVYEHIVFDQLQHQSAAIFEALSRRSFITASFGKTFHNTGWRIGYCVAPRGLMSEFRKVHQYNVFSVQHPVQVALANYLKTPSHYLDLPNFFQKKRDFFIDAIKTSRFKSIPSQGTYFQLLDYSEISSEGDVSFAERLTKVNKLATIPTSVFNKEKEDFKQIRVCFAKTEATLESAAQILNKL